MSQFRNFFSLLLLGFSFGLIAVVEAQDVCNLCKQSSAAKCREICAGAGPNIKICESGCANNRCQDKCWMQTVEPEETKKLGDLEIPSGEDISAACDACVKQMEKGKCVAPCEDKDNPAACQMRCAKVNCAKKCDLPGTVAGEVAPDRRKTIEACRSCKSRVQVPCDSECGEKNRPGFVACHLGCVEQQCLESCKPGLF